MTDIQFNLTLPADTSLDEVVRPFSALKQAAELLPVRRVSSVLLLGPAFSQRIDVHGDHDHGGLLLQLEQQIPIRHDRQGQPLRCGRGEATAWIVLRPRRVVGLQVQPGFEGDSCDLVVADYDEQVLVAGIGAAAGRRLLVQTGREGWSGESICSTGGRDSTLIDFLLGHLVVVALLDTLLDLGVQTEVADSTGFARTRTLAALIAAFPGTDAPNWVDHGEHLESLRNLAELTHAVDSQLLPGDP